MLFTPVFENKADEQCNKYYLELKQAFKVKRLPLFFYISGNFPEFLELITSQITKNLKNPQFNSLISEINKALSSLFKDYKLSEKFDTQFKQSAKSYKEEINSLFLITLKTLLFLYAIREALKDFVFGIKSLPSQNLNKQTFNFSTSTENYKISQSAQNYILYSETLPAKTSDKSLVKKPSTLPILPFPQFLKKAETLFSEEIKKESFAIYRLGVEKLFLNFLLLLPEKIEINYKFLLESLKKYKNYDKFIPLLSENFLRIYLYKLFLLLFLKKLETY